MAVGASPIRWAGTPAIIVVLVLAAGVLHASEYGVGTYRPGQVDLFAGTLPPPGGVLIKQYFLFQDGSLTAQPNNAPVRVHTHTITYTDATLMIYTTPWRILGGTGECRQSRRRGSPIKPCASRRLEDPLRRNTRRWADSAI